MRALKEASMASVPFRLPRWLGLGLRLLGFLAMLPSVGWTQDTLRPTLVSSFPPNGARAVDPTTPARFLFSEAMKPQQSILWMSSPVAVGSNRVAYSWSADSRELTATPVGGWPTNQTISWIFQPGIPAIPGVFPGVLSFEDLAGNRPSGGVGTFTTSSGGPAPWIRTTNNCGVVSSNLLRTAIRLARSAIYLQTNSEPPMPLAEAGIKPFTVVASLVPGVGSATSVLLQVPRGETLVLTNRGPEFSRTDTFDTAEAMAEAFPPGTNRFVVNGAVGDVPSQAEVFTPETEGPRIHVSNYEFLQGTVDTNSIPVLWDRPPGTTNDSLQVVVRPLASPAQTVWTSPDRGCPGALDGGSGGVEIPFAALTGRGSFFYVDIRLDRRWVDDGPGVSARREFSWSTLTRTRLVLCGSAGRPVRERDPRGLPDRCDEVLATVSTNGLRFLGVPILEPGQLRIRVGPTAVGNTYQLFEWLLEPDPTDPARVRPAPSGPTLTPVGPPSVALGAEVEFGVPFDHSTVARVFGVANVGGRR